MSPVLGARVDCSLEALLGRFRALQVSREGSDCLAWRGHVDLKGYARFSVPDGSGRSRSWNAHNWLYRQLRGPVPAGHCLDHACHSSDDICTGGPICLHRQCTDLDHLELVTRSENTLRSYRIRTMDRSVCSSGHDRTPENTFISKGYPACRLCQRESNRRSYWKRKGVD